VFGDPLRGQRTFAGSEQRAAGPAVAGRNEVAGGLGGGGVGEQGAPVAGQDHTGGARRRGVTG
jgi:hypothetical protein